jgi:NAD dependent epimerase/dehydratase family
MAKRAVLLTGATGYIASQLLPVFRERYELTLVDVKNTDPQGQTLPGVHIASLAEADPEPYAPLFQGIDTVVHLGYHRPPGGEWGTRSYHDERVNVDMAYNVFKLSLDAGVQRLVVASSNHAADWYEQLIHQGLMDTVYPDTFPLSDNFYGWAKATYEHLGFVFACGHFGRQLGNVHIRIGAPRELRLRDYGDDRARYKRDLGAYISPGDLQQLFVKSIEAADIANEHGIPFQIFYGISNNARRFWSIVNARKVIGYMPEDDAEVKYAPDIATFLMGPQ